MSKKISFVIPAYNVGQYITRCLESIVKQKFTDFEIIVVDDNSTDDTVKIVENFNNSHVSIHQTPSSKGYAGQPRNIGMALATGEYICFIDPDDFYFGDALKESFEKNIGYDLIINSYAVANEQTNDYRITGYYMLKDEDYDYDVNYHTATNGVCLQRTIFKTSFLRNNNILFNEELPSQDSMLMLDVMMCQPKIKLTNFLTTVYICDREGSVTNTFSKAKVAKGIEAMSVIYVKIKESDYSDREKNALMGIYINRYLQKIDEFIDDEIVEYLKGTPYFHYYARRKVLDV